MVSVIIPIFNEEEALKRNLPFILPLHNLAEVIFVDSQSNDKSISVIQGVGRVLSGQRGRAAAMNLGASQAKGNILLFLHADTTIEPQTIRNIEKNIRQFDAVGGSLTQRIEAEGFIYRLIEAQGNFRAHLTKEFYGDQGIFVKKEEFLAIGGFPGVPIMEDVLFSRRLRRSGKTIILADKINVSARRWRKLGVIKTTLLYNLIIILFTLRVPLDKIKKLYDDLR